MVTAGSSQHCHRLQFISINGKISFFHVSLSLSLSASLPLKRTIKRLSVYTFCFCWRSYYLMESSAGRNCCYCTSKPLYALVSPAAAAVVASRPSQIAPCHRSAIWCRFSSYLSSPSRPPTTNKQCGRTAATSRKSSDLQPRLLLLQRTV